jgi:hypothetical protein
VKYITKCTAYQYTSLFLTGIIGRKWATELNRTFSKEEVQMAKKSPKNKKQNHMKKCSPSLAIKEMQIKTTLRFYFTLVRIAITKNTTKKE